MVHRVFNWVSGGLLTGVLALGTHAGVAAQSGGDASSLAEKEAGCRAARLANLEDRIESRMTAMADRLAGSAALLVQDLKPEIADEEDDDRQGDAVSITIHGPGWLGIGMEEVSAEKAKDLKLPAVRGVLVTRVAEDSPAAKAGLKVNDVITEFDGQRVEGTLALERMVRETPSGRDVSISIWRDGNTQSLHAELAARRRAFRRGEGEYRVGPGEWGFNFEMPPMPAIPEIPAMPSLPAIQIGPMGGMRIFGAPMLGIDAEDLSGQLGNYFGAPEGEGVLVREVMPGSAAEKGGLKAGDVIVRVDGGRVRNAEELRSILREKLDKATGSADQEKAAPVTAELTVLRSGKQVTARVELQPPVRRLRTGRRIAV